MAVIVEVPTSEPDQAPAGRDGRFTSEQKAKTVPRDRSQRDFLRQFVSQTPEPSGHTTTKSQEASRLPDVKEEPHRRYTPHKMAHSEFQREASQIPEGGWFRKTTDDAGGGGRGPPSTGGSSPTTTNESSSESESEGASTPPSPSSSDSDSSRSGKSKSEKRHRTRQKSDHKRMRKALAGIKIKPPFVWDGTADLDVFDQWTYEVDTWGELNELSDRIVLKLMVQFMSGDPGHFFMCHVSTRQSEWTVKKLYEALFDYCFPTDYKARLRARLERSAQGRSRVRDFVRDIQQLAIQFPDVSDFQLVQIFWRGLNTYIRVYLIEKGLNPEKTKLDKLVKYAIQKEEAYSEARREERAFSGQVPGRSWGRFGTRAEGPEPYKPSAERQEGESYKPSAERQEGESYKDKSKPTKNTTAESKPSRNETAKAPQKDHECSNPLSREERDRLRAEGRCFTCKDVGHQSSNCPTRKTAKAPTGPGIHVGSINFADLDRLAARAQRASDDALFLGAVSFETLDEDKPMASTEGVWARAHEEDCKEYIQALFQSYYDEMTAHSVGLEPLQCFEVDAYGGRSTFLVVDHLAPIGLPDEYIVTREQLDNPSWGVPDIIQEEWDAFIQIPPRPEWGTGFPQCDARMDGDVSPLYWLRAHVKASLRKEFPDVPEQTELVHVGLHPHGYVATSALNDEEYIFTHEDVTQPTFDPTAVSRVVLDGYSPDELWQHWRAKERRKQRRLRLMVCAVGMRKPQQHRKKKPVAVPANAIPAIEWNTMRPKDYTRTTPMPVVVSISINGHPARALLDTGCMADFVSTTLVDQLKIHTDVL
ncbi:uncharacterized protein TRAVEDRAFT_24776 [Trametes versicolor FP-101664 SS1]|uniref:CCHC-type domain-containing protein n=1 Tax=Trametes versicolor (strain FP-101664) TaxID=717944 RepID=R7S8Y2_TRAVS|nr:uncharacterized protein TRAVEDRAFT_24776 [Trametes versicolor FP-101664 SS1]EIW52097.1 hypothetical protein TRAVEDRAFT_24776 [Trametes versicolor FP-101664 SS1]